MLQIFVFFFWYWTVFDLIGQLISILICFKREAGSMKNYCRTLTFIWKNYILVWVLKYLVMERIFTTKKLFHNPISFNYLFPYFLGNILFFFCHALRCLKVTIDNIHNNLKLFSSGDRTLYIKYFCVSTYFWYIHF